VNEPSKNVAFVVWLLLDAVLDELEDNGGLLMLVADILFVVVVFQYQQ